MEWRGVFPAAPTQFRADGALDLPATQRVLDALVREGVHGIIVLGTVGENYALEPDEKLALLAAAREAVAGRVPILSGVAEAATAAAQRYARAAESAGVDGLMVLPSIAYGSQPVETLTHYRAIAAASALPIMLYNNPIGYRVDVTVAMCAALTDVATIVAIKESTTATHRIVDLTNAGLHKRYALFCGVDDIVLESLLLGAVGWVSGLANAFPRECLALYDLARAGRVPEALTLYRWFMPLLHLDTLPTLVQCIKLAAQLTGYGSEAVRLPRLVLAGPERAHVIGLVEAAIATRPDLATLGLRNAAQARAPIP